MKRTVFLLLLMVITFFSFSQNFKGGLLAGLAATQVDGDGYGGFHRVGGIGGVWVSLPIDYTFTLRTELKVIQKGSYKGFKDGAGTTVDSYSLRLNYVEMPFLLEYHRWDNIVPFFGLSGGYLWHFYERKNNYDVGGDENRHRFRKWELGIHGGVEYILNRNFSFGATFSYSVLPVRKHEGNVNYLWHMDFGQFNQVLQFVVRYHF